MIIIFYYITIYWHLSYISTPIRLNYIQKIKFLYRARRYRHPLDKPEIAFTLSNLRDNYCALDIGAHKGAEDTLTKFHPNLIFECEQRHHSSDSIQDVFAFLHNLGYKGYFFQKGDIHPLGEFNFEQGNNINDPEYVNNFLFTVENIIFE